MKVKLEYQHDNNEDGSKDFVEVEVESFSLWRDEMTFIARVEGSLVNEIEELFGEYVTIKHWSDPSCWTTKFSGEIVHLIPVGTVAIEFIGEQCNAVGVLFND